MHVLFNIKCEDIVLLTLIADFFLCRASHFLLFATLGTWQVVQTENYISLPAGFYEVL